MATGQAIAIKHRREENKIGLAMTAVLSHILVVEDDEEIAALVAKYLSANEYRVTCARDGRE
ncbi:MAG: hypothetical protein AB7K78_16975, partial [Xanthobacteraceae bacterium]